jgi:hypothetical protein
MPHCIWRAWLAEVQETNQPLKGWLMRRQQAPAHTGTRGSCQEKNSVRRYHKPSLCDTASDCCRVDLYSHLTEKLIKELQKMEPDNEEVR